MTVCEFIVTVVVIGIICKIGYNSYSFQKDIMASESAKCVTVIITIAAIAWVVYDATKCL